MADVTEEKRKWLTAVLGVAWPEEGEGDEEEDGDDDGGGRQRRGRKGKDGKPTLSESDAKKIAKLIATARQSYDKALSDVGAEIIELGGKLLKSPDEELRTIGRLGLADVIQGGKVTLTAYLQQLGDGSNIDKVRELAPKLADAANDYASMLLADPRVRALDENPFSSPVSIRDTLVPAVLSMADAAKGG